MKNMSIGKQIIVKAAVKMASIQANSSCLLYGYQPKEPKALNKLKKIK
ncbi:MAG: cyclic lactone autoinducer peptide [Clostridia bacterium]|nr:cyclic lactone autoinducer peptide [Clostridia bacterium]